MCVVAGTAAAAALSTASTAVGMIGTVAGIAQAQQSAAFQQQQANQARETQRRQAEIANQQSANNLVGEVAQQKSKQDAYQQNLVNTTSAANKVAAGKQAKLTEARKKAGFKAQNIYAKSIGAKGSILAAGRSGQSVGLLVNDVERQAGFAKAQELSMAESKVEQAEIGMQGASLKALSDNQTAANNIGFNPSNPSLPEMPDLPSFIDGSQFSIA